MKNTATLLISCPDRKGLVAAIANFLYTYNANILHADQHQDAAENHEADPDHERRAEALLPPSPWPSVPRAARPVSRGSP